MKKHALVSILLALAGCSTVPPVPLPAGFRPDVLYYQNNDEGLKAAQEITHIYGGKQEVALTNEKLPPLRPPAPRFQVRPDYPVELRATEMSGDVLVDFIVDESGSVVHAKALASPHPALSAAAVNALLRWKFTPAQLGGVNVRTHLRVTFFFSIDRD